METHKNLKEDEKEDMRQQLREFKAFYNTSEDSIPLCASLVIVPVNAFNEYSFFTLRRQSFETNDESKKSEFEEDPEMIASIQSLKDLMK